MNQVNDLEDLVAPLSLEEMDRAIKHMPVNKAHA
jgi:hypothetical protein